MSASTRIEWRSLLVLTFSALLAGAVPAGAQPLLDRLTIVAPAAPGGGWDQTARAMQRTLEAEGLVRVVQVENVPGAAGTVGLAQFINDPPRSEPSLLVTGLVMVGAIVFNGSSVSLTRTTPIAKLTGEFEVVVVPSLSPIREMHDLTDRFRADPTSVSWGGGSAGGTDHILVGLMAAAAGIDPGRINYIAFSGGGEAVAAVLGGQVTAAVSGISEFAPHIASGRLRALAISAPSPQPGIDARPLSDHGLPVALSNWRGLVAPPGISDGARRQLSDLVGRMVRSASWQRTLREHGWSDQFLRDIDFDSFLNEERVRVMRIAQALRAEGPRPSGSSRLFPLLVLIGAVVIVGALIIEHVRSPSRRLEYRVPPVRNRRRLGLVSAALLLYPLGLMSAGFVVASAALFWMVAAAFGSDHRVRDGVIAVVFVLGVYGAFAAGLGVTLPGGWVVKWIR